MLLAKGLYEYGRTACLTLLLLLLAACAGVGVTNPTPLPADDGQSREGVTPTPMPSAPAWREPVTVITRDNVAQIELLGRLDQLGTTSTLFSHALSPDSTRLAALSNTNLIAWDLITGQRLYSVARQGTSYLFYSPDKVELYLLDGEGRVLVMDAETGTLKTEFQGHPAFNEAHTYNVDLGLLALGGADGTIKVWDALERRSLVTFEAHPGEVARMVFSPDGELLATTDLSGEVRLWNWRERTLVNSLDNQGARIIRMAFTPDGEQLAVGADSFINLWRVTDGEYRYTLQSDSGAVSDVLLYSPDGRFLVNGGTIPDMNVWDATTGDFLALLPELGGEPVSASFSPDGELLLASELDGRVTLWDMTNITSETVVRADLNVGTDRVLEVQWTPDGFLMLFFDAIGPVYVWGVPADSNSS